jgi:hypothetical protein
VLCSWRKREGGLPCGNIFTPMMPAAAAWAITSGVTGGVKLGEDQMDRYLSK